MYMFWFSMLQAKLSILSIVFYDFLRNLTNNNTLIHLLILIISQIRFT